MTKPLACHMYIVVTNDSQQHMVMADRFYLDYRCKGSQVVFVNNDDTVSVFNYEKIMGVYRRAGT